MVEIFKVLEGNNLWSCDISWVGSKDGAYAMTWDEFHGKFKNLKYNSGYGVQEIATDLVVVSTTKGWWLERHAYDGSEWWVVKKMPTLTNNPKLFNKIISDCMGWATLNIINSCEDRGKVK